VIREVVVDTGPLIALIDRSDRHHAWMHARLSEIVPPLETCEAVLSEACFLARRIPGGVPSILALFEQGACAITFSLAPNLREVSACIQQYLDLPGSVADACLVRMSELAPQSVVLTFDGDFRVYRRNRRQRIPLLMPPDL
jgi:predicted nucleic acid-binding protein